MLPAQHLQIKQDELQKQYNLLTEEIEFLQNSSRTDDLSPREKFRLSKQVEAAEQERNLVVEQLSKLETFGDSDKLYNALLKLGYQHQVRIFRRLIETTTTGAFLIHGPTSEHGQDWLLNRLVSQYVPNCITGKVVKIGLSRKVRKSDVSALWRELGRRFGLRDSQPSPTAVIQRIIQALRTQNVLLVFHEVDYLPKACLAELIKTLWMPLVEISLDQNITNEFKLLLFLIDYNGVTARWNTPFAEKLDTAWKPSAPLKSPKIEEFSNEDLLTWVELNYDNLPTGLTHEADATVEVIIENTSSGIPELVFVDICGRCHFDWYEESEKWMKL